MPNQKIRAHAKFDDIVARLKHKDDALNNRLNAYWDSFIRGFPDLETEHMNVLAHLSNDLGNAYRLQSSPSFPSALPPDVYTQLNDFFSDLLGQ